MAVASCNGLAERGTLPPEGQIVLGVATDAWLPRGVNGVAAEPTEQPVALELETAPLFERLRVEFFAPGSTDPCRDCLRDFGIDVRTISEGRASVGFIPQKGVSGYRARVRIYHSGPSESYSEPRPRSTIETVIDLPPVGAEGIVPVHVVLRTDDLGRPRGTLDAPVKPDAGPPPTKLANTWHADVRRACRDRDASGPDEACVPGGAFWMGDPSFAVPFERLVVVSPFYIDLREVTVADMRASGLAKLPPLGDPSPRSPDPTSSSSQCTYTNERGADEELALNCVSLALARKYCDKLGRRLPSEVEVEFVSGARRDATFPWGEQSPTCGDAIFGRNHNATKPIEFRACTNDGIGVAKPGSGRIDRLRLPGSDREIVDLAGNVAEWVEDEYSQDSEPCLAENPAVDPVCREKSTKVAGLSLVRGTSWDLPGASSLRAAVRSTFVGQLGQEVGFRCARDGK